MKEDTFIRPGLDLSFTVVDDAMKIMPAVLASLRERHTPEGRDRPCQVLSGRRSGLRQRAQTVGPKSW